MKFRLFTLALGLATALGLASQAGAQDADYTLNLTDASGSVNGTAEVSVLYTTGETAASIQGYSFGVCNDSLLEVASTDDIANGDALDGLTFTFSGINALDGGWTVGVLFNVFDDVTLDPSDTDQELYVVTYSLGSSAGTSTLEVCGTLGDPTVPLSIVVDSDEIVPTAGSADVEIVDTPPYTMALSDETANYAIGDGNASITSTMTIEELDTNAGFPNDTQGFQLGIMHDGALLEPTGVEAAGAMADMRDGDGPAFLGANLDPDGGPGVTVGVVYSLMSDAFLQFDGETIVLDFSYKTVASALADDTDGEVTMLEFSDELGDPVLPCGIVVGTKSYAVEKIDATITLNAATDMSFVRGDANDDGKVNIADGVWILQAVIGAGDASTCAASMDVNADDKSDLSDAVYLLMYRFLGGDAPEAPFPGCGIDEGADCASFDSCS